MNVHISPEKIQEYEITRDAQDNAFRQGGAVRGANHILKLATPDQVSYAENVMQYDFDTRVGRASLEAEFLATTEQGKTITYYLEGLSNCEKVLNRGKENPDETSRSLSDTMSGSQFGTRVVTEADLAKNAEKNAVLNFAREVGLGGFGLPASEQFQWLRDSRARLQEMAPSLAQNPRYLSGESVSVKRNARDGHDAYFENDWNVGGITVNGYFLVEKSTEAGDMHKEVPIQDLDEWNKPWNGSDLSDALAQDIS